jgi:predicted nuclease of predicted toxin-antitoxin system
VTVRILVDMGVDIRVADWLRRQGHDAVHLRDEGLQRMPNGEIFEKAIAEDRIILTCDLDFGEIAAALKDALGKILRLRLHDARAANVIRRLTTVLPRVEAELAAGAVVIVEEARHRIRALPIGTTSDPS